MPPADRTAVYTDGACSGNPGPGGWAWVVPDGPWASGAEARTTNQRMEVTAAYEAVRSLDGPLVVLSDSTYVVHCFRDRWWEGWLRRGWKTSSKQPVANRDLWEPFIALVRDRADVRFQWVPGHSGERWNDVADRLAVEAAARQEGASGTSSSGLAAAADDRVATPARARDARLPAGHRMVVQGHRPPELGGYDPDNPVAAQVRRQLGEVLAAQAQLHPDLVLLTGLQLGAEQLAAAAARDQGVPYVAVLAFDGMEERWPARTRARFAKLRLDAADVIVLEGASPASPQWFGAAMRRRDAFLAEAADSGLVVWDGSDPHLGRAYATLDEATEGQVVLITPPPAG